MEMIVTNEPLVGSWLLVDDFANRLARVANEVEGIRELTAAALGILMARLREAAPAVTPLSGITAFAESRRILHGYAGVLSGHGYPFAGRLAECIVELRHGLHHGHACEDWSRDMLLSMADRLRDGIDTVCAHPGEGPLPERVVPYRIGVEAEQFMRQLPPKQIFAFICKGLAEHVAGMELDAPDERGFSGLIRRYVCAYDVLQWCADAECAMLGGPASDHFRERIQGLQGQLASPGDSGDLSCVEVGKAMARILRAEALPGSLLPAMREGC